MLSSLRSALHMVLNPAEAVRSFSGFGRMVPWRRYQIHPINSSLSCSVTAEGEDFCLLIGRWLCASREVINVWKVTIRLVSGFSLSRGWRMRRISFQPSIGFLPLRFVKFWLAFDGDSTHSVYWIFEVSNLSLWRKEDHHLPLSCGLFVFLRRYTSASPSLVLGRVCLAKLFIVLPIVLVLFAVNHSFPLLRCAVMTSAKAQDICRCRQVSCTVDSTVNSYIY